MYIVLVVEHALGLLQLLDHGRDVALAELELVEHAADPLLGRGQLARGRRGVGFCSLRNASRDLYALGASLRSFSSCLQDHAVTGAGAASAPILLRFVVGLLLVLQLALAELAGLDAIGQLEEVADQEGGG